MSDILNIIVVIMDFVIANERASKQEYFQAFMIFVLGVILLIKTIF